MASTILTSLPHPFFALAPMDDVTDTVFRQIVQTCASPDIYFTEFVNVDGLQSPGRDKLVPRLTRQPQEKSLIAQLWGLQPENFYKTAQELSAMGFAGIDLNMGCPVKAVVKNGACSALIQNREKAIAIIQATKAGADGKLPVSVKTRLGFNTVDFTWPALLLKQGLAMLTIHGRTRAQMSKVPADWEAIGRIRELRDELAPGTLIVGNGDVANRSEGLDLAERYKLDGIMIGRGVLSDPYAFAAVSPWPDYDRRKRLTHYAQHIRLFEATWQHGERSPLLLNKFCKLYVNGFDGAKELREKLMSASSSHELLAMVEAAA